MFLKVLQNLQENTCARASFLKDGNFTKGEALEQMFSRKFSEIFKNTFFTEHFWRTAADFILVNFAALQCTDCNSTINRLHHRFFSEYVPKTIYLYSRQT